MYEKKSTPIMMILMALVLTALTPPLLAAADAKAQRELEIMTGILETTLGFINEPSSGRLLRTFGGSEVEGYLLPDQGVVFLVSLEQRQSWGTGLLEAAELAEAQVGQDRDPRMTEDRVTDLKAALQREQKETRERLEKQQEKFQEAKMLLVEAVVEYGKSFTTLEDNEFINLILRSSGRGGAFLVGYRQPMIAGSEPSTGRNEVIAIRRSEIHDYEAGTLSLERLMQRVLTR